MKNELAAHPTTWKAWYAIFGLAAVVVASSIMMLGGLAEGLPGGVKEGINGLLIPLQFIAFAALALGAIALVTRTWPTAADLGLRRGLTRRDLLVVLVVFVVTHAFFWVLGQVVGDQGDQAAGYFAELRLDGPLVPAVAGMFATVILAPVCEELLYRGTVLRPIHDSLARRGSSAVAAVVAILFSAAMFALPHLGGSLTGWQALAYLVTGCGFGLVYVSTGSMTAAMVAHSLQSCVAMAQVLLFGRGDSAVSPILWILVFGCPVWVYLVARGLHAVFPRERVAQSVAG